MNINNTFYVLSSSSDVLIDKMHICTWDVKGSNAFIEIGLCISVAANTPLKFDLYTYLPFICQSSVISSLHTELSDDANFRFIFNCDHSSKVLVNNDARNGSIFTVKNGENIDEKFAVLNISPSVVDKHFVKFEFSRESIDAARLYGRILIKTNYATLANTVSGIAKKDYLFDLKINEARNKPNEVFDFERANTLTIASVKTIILLHAIPEEWNINYSDSSKLKNVRRLEIDAFKRYMSWIDKVDDEYLITFSKAEAKDGTSFFTSFTKEHVSNKQLLVAVVMNIVCSLLFGISQCPDDKEKTFLQVLPFTYLLAIAILLLGFVYIFNLHSSLWRWIKSLKS